MGFAQIRKIETQALQEVGKQVPSRLKAVMQQQHSTLRAESYYEMNNIPKALKHIRRTLDLLEAKGIACSVILLSTVSFLLYIIVIHCYFLSTTTLGNFGFLIHLLSFPRMLKEQQEWDLLRRLLELIQPYKELTPTIGLIMQSEEFLKEEPQKDIKREDI